MNKINLIYQVTQFISNFRGNLLYLFIVMMILWINTFYTRYPDEFDNIVGGWYITKGILPYIGFFSHHNPGAYYFSSLIVLFSQQSFVVFRMGLSIMTFLWMMLPTFYLKRSFKWSEIQFYFFFIIILAISATYSWGHMMLSETIVGYMLVPAYALVFIKSWLHQSLDIKDILFLSVTTFIALFTSMTFTFAILAFWSYVFLYFRHYEGFRSRKFVKSIFIIVLPYILFVLYLLFTKSWGEYYYQSIIYNRDFYIYNFPIVAGKVSTHPVRYAISIFYNVTDQFWLLLGQIKDFNFSYPVNVTLLIGNFCLIVFLLINRKYTLSLLVYLLIVYTNSRSSPLSSKESDYQSTVYIWVSLYNIVFIVHTLYKALSEKINESKKFIYKFLLILLIIYVPFTVLFLTKKFIDKAYDRYMGRAPAIYDEPVVAPIINKIVSKDEYYWIGPFEFQELLYINAKLPTKYHWFLPANARSEKIIREFQSDLRKNKPKLIVFKDNLSFFGAIPQEYIFPVKQILDSDYFQIKDLKSENQKYTVTYTQLNNFDLETNFYFDKNRKDEIITLLLYENIIELQ